MEGRVLSERRGMVEGSFGQETSYLEKGMDTISRLQDLGCAARGHSAEFRSVAYVKSNQLNIPLEHS